MNRREAVKLLTALPMVKSIEVARVEPTDVIVIESDDILSDQHIRNITAAVVHIWPGRQVAVFGRGLRMRIARQQETL